MCNHHQKDTRGSNSALTLLLNRTESGEQTFDFQGAIRFNKLPKEVWDEGSLVLFNHKLKSVTETLHAFV